MRELKKKEVLGSWKSPRKLKKKLSLRGEESLVYRTDVTANSRLLNVIANTAWLNMLLQTRTTWFTDVVEGTVWFTDVTADTT